MLNLTEKDTTPSASLGLGRRIAINPIILLGIATDPVQCPVPDILIAILLLHTAAGVVSYLHLSMRKFANRVLSPAMEISIQHLACL